MSPRYLPYVVRAIAAARGESAEAVAAASTAAARRLFGCCQLRDRVLGHGDRVDAEVRARLGGFLESRPARAVLRNGNLELGGAELAGIPRPRIPASR